VSIVLAEFYIGKNTTDYVQLFQHLGNVIDLNKNDSDTAVLHRKQFIVELNNILFAFRKKTDLFNLILCTSCSIQYGIQAW
jgi:hypothetical protein